MFSDLASFPRIHPSKHSSWWRRLKDVFVFRRRHDQDEYIRLSHTSSEDVFKINILVLVVRVQDVFKTFSRCLQDAFKITCQDVFKTFSRHLQDVLPRPLQDVFKTFSRRLATTSSSHLQDVLQRCLQDVFKMYHQVKPFFSTRLRDIFNTFLRRTAKTVIYRRICLGLTLEKFMVSVQNLQV